MKFYVLLVTAFLATAMAQLSTGDLSVARCDALNEKECSGAEATEKFNCTWCSGLSRCRTKTLGCECKECPLSLKFETTCPDGSTLPIKCNMEKCAWVSGECPSGPTKCECLHSLQSTTRVCPDGTTISPTCIVEKNCSWIYPTCPTCDGCRNASIPEDSIRICPDGTSTKPVCDDVKCAWFVPSCPPSSNESVCPPNVPIVQCIVSPCEQARKNPYYNSEAVTCKEDYCGGCNARCYNKAGEEVKCVVEKEIDCSDDSHCTGDKPSVDDCKTEPKIYCAPSFIRGSCHWHTYCPPADPTTPVICDEKACGNNTIKSIAICRNGEKPNWICDKVELNYASDTRSSVITQCQWVSKCPPIVEDTKKCVVGGVCGDQCVDAKAPEVSILPVIDATICRSNVTCEQRCSLSYRIAGSCSHREGFGCQFSYQDGYYDCLKKCAGEVVEQPVCGGSACDCDYSKCYLCVLSLTLDSGRKLSKGVCASQTYGDACAAFGGSAAYEKPEKCSIISETGSEVPTEVATVIKTIREKVNTSRIQDKINEVIDTIPETKNLFISATLTTEPQVTEDKEVSYDIVLSITGAGDLTAQQKIAICDRIVKPALESTISNSKKRLICKIEKVVGGNAKRALLQTSSSTYSANVVTAQALQTTGDNNDGDNNGNGAGSIVFSFFAAIVALLALIVY